MSLKQGQIRIRPPWRASSHIFSIGKMPLGHFIMLCLAFHWKAILMGTLLYLTGLSETSAPHNTHGLNQKWSSIIS